MDQNKMNAINRNDKPKVVKLKLSSLQLKEAENIEI